ncbi:MULTISPECIES: hypothetical protein [Xanthomonas]|uniref:hypothetical protein n=1 Tax=Xanthomonas TaxID=338 RepID=UPI00240644E9|nr:hypothetical protein [Xanthomonas euvesicatoria]
MKTIAMMLLATALSMAGTTRATGTTPPASATAELAREAAAFFKDSQPGGVVLVTRGDQVLLRRAYGMADIEMAWPCNRTRQCGWLRSASSSPPWRYCNWCRRASCNWIPAWSQWTRR